jgi:hypothetical protein
VLFFSSDPTLYVGKLPTPSKADAYQTYEWHYVAEAWGTFDCQALVSCLVAHAQLGLEPLAWFKSPRQQHMLLHLLSQRGQLEAFFAARDVPLTTADRDYADVVGPRIVQSFKDRGVDVMLPHNFSFVTN